MDTTPSSLLDRLRRSPSEEQWGRFVEVYTPLLFAWANRLGLAGADAADLVQDVFVVLVQRFPAFDYDARKSFRAWLKTILLNLWRKRRRRQAVERTAAGDLARNGPADDEPFVELDEEEYRRLVVRRALAVMQTDFAPETWQAAWEFVVRGRPAAEVAAELGVTLNAVYLAKSRVLRRLREELRGLLD